MSIQTRPATDEYRDGWERTFNPEPPRLNPDARSEPEPAPEPLRKVTEFRGCIENFDGHYFTREDGREVAINELVPAAALGPDWDAWVGHGVPGRYRIEVLFWPDPEPAR